MAHSKGKHIIAEDTLDALRHIYDKQGSLSAVVSALKLSKCDTANLSSMLRNIPGEVSLEYENKIRVKLGLAPIQCYVMVPCPCCGGKHELRDCDSKPKRKRKPRKTLEMSPNLYDWLNEMRIQADMNWHDFLVFAGQHFCFYEFLEDAPPLPEYPVAKIANDTLRIPNDTGGYWEVPRVGYTTSG